MSLHGPVIRPVLLAFALLWLGAGVPAARGAEGDVSAAGSAGTGAVKSVLWLSMAPRMGPALLTHEQVFRTTLKTGLSEEVVVHAEYLEMTPDRERGPRGGRGGVLRGEVR